MELQLIIRWLQRLYCYVQQDMKRRDQYRGMFATLRFSSEYSIFPSPAPNHKDSLGVKLGFSLWEKKKNRGSLGINLPKRIFAPKRRGVRGG
jgi:hypothetical protein